MELQFLKLSHYVLRFSSDMELDMWQRALRFLLNLRLNSIIT